MVGALSPLTKAAPLAAAAALASTPLWAAAAHLPPRPTPPPAAETAETRYDQVLVRQVASFLQLLRANQEALPPLALRPVVFGALAHDGVFEKLPLHPLERSALLHLATSEPALVETTVLATLGRIRHGAFTERDMFAGLKDPVAMREAVPPVRLSREELKWFARMLAVCQFLTGEVALHSPGAKRSKSDLYLSTLPEARRQVLIRCIGACILTGKLPMHTEAHSLGASFIGRTAPSVTKTDLESLPQLELARTYSDREVLARTVIAVVLGGIISLWPRARSGSVATPSGPEGTT